MTAPARAVISLLKLPNQANRLPQRLYVTYYIRISAIVKSGRNRHSGK